ncbi:peptidylprolyl isomerase [Algoriphagus sediminis]|uniref:Peptidylprolyl isomerase n=1 Tax=Algoriphagus sediminis TaxID=3057113 RepID=A0ABT7YED9_9BACT|nr:peptidylprolyl isomerase [Algoriphagus sediminis]MDN3204889.1 peptidylprolyl isomerase [Algoriphagus sediminis]
MNFYLKIATFYALLSCLSFFQMEGALADQSDEIMTIGGEPVSKSELIYLISKGQKEDPSVGGLSREEFEENLELFVNYKLKVKEAESLNLHKTEEFLREYESFKENLMAPYLIKNSLEEGEVRKAYSRMQEVVRASHILFQFPPNASKEDSLIVLRMAVKVKQEVENGGNINELAVEYSDDPSAKLNRGDLGYFTALQMVPAFEDAVYNMRTGEISDPVLTDFGYHIIQVMDRRPNPGQVKVSHLLVRIDPENPDGEDNAKRLVGDIYQEIQKESTSWTEIVKNFSEDASTREKGGMLPWFSVGSMIPEFEMTAFSLSEEGEISPPVKTQYGYHILRLEDKRPLESFESQEQVIRSKILRASRRSLIQSQVMAIQKSRYSFEENESNYLSLKENLEGFSRASDYQNFKDSPNWSDSELFRISGKAYTTTDFLSFVSWKERIPNSNSETLFDSWYTAFTAECLNRTEEKDVTESNRDYQMTLNEYRDGILLFSLMNQEVWQKGIMDSLGQRSYYNANLEDYFWKDRVEAMMVKVLDIGKASLARDFLISKNLTPDLKKEFENSIQSQNQLAFQSEYGLMEIDNHPVLSSADLNQTYQEVEANGHLHLLVIGDVIEGGPKDFTEIRGLVIKDYQEYLDDSLIEKLREKYPIVIDEEAKEEAFIALNQ